MGQKKQLNYDKLRKHHRELGVPWTDSSFPPSDSSIGLQKCRELGRLEWRRVTELSERPRLVVAGVGRHDVLQGRLDGKLGNCWFVAAASVLAGVPSLWERVLPDLQGQEWDSEHPDNYCGVFRFVFWRFGVWEEVLVDDLIPTHDGRPVFTHSRDNDEWWGALMEKAYAKLHGSYEALDGGNLSDALVDFTGGVSELVLLETDAGQKLYEDEEKRSELFSRLVEEVSQHSLICCAVRAARSEQDKRTEHGLVKGHAYGVTAVRRVTLGEAGLVGRIKGREKVNLVRLRNPWGEKEWTGAFSDGKGKRSRSRSGSGGKDERLYSPRHLNTLFSRSVEWRSISQKEKEKLGLVNEDEGEFWMPFEDFVFQFTDVSMTHLINTSLFSFSKTWKEFKTISSWSRAGGRAGGCMNHPATFLDNPQFRFDLRKPEEVIIQLSQIDDRAKVLASERSKLVIGFQVLEVESNRKHRLHSLIAGYEDSGGASDFIKSSHVFMRKSLRPGRYLIIPSTFQPGQDGQFLLRLFSETSDGLTSLETDRPSPPWLCCGSQPVMVTRLTVISALSLVKQDMIGGADPYVFITCEGVKLRSEAVKSSLNPEWKFSVILYRHNPAKGIKIQIWNKNIMMDQFMGQRVITDTNNPFSEEVSRVEKTLELYNKGSKQDEKMGGSIKISIENHQDLTAL